ncbi:MAG TPA: HIT family protein [Xanthomonadaceae bacterium]|nr:HIT family protein [Xanthomonadaceae bacterium]
MSAFALDERLAADSVAVVELPLCEVRLMDDARWPWLLLVPRRPGLRELIDLDAADRRALCEEVDRAAHALHALFAPDKLNVATLGNVVEQLHVHLVARYRDDAAWPLPVWGQGARIAYQDGERARRQAALRGALA